MPDEEAAGPTPEDIQRFLKWKKKQKSPGMTLDRQYNLFQFKQKYGVEKGSNFHCPWCWGGRLFYNETEKFYVCRDCELKFQIECLDQEMLDNLVLKKKAERAQKRLDKKGQAGAKPGHEDIPPEVLAHLRSIGEEDSGDNH